MKFGYCRVSTGGQDLGSQVEALKGAGVERIYEETASGGKWERVELHRMLEFMRKGDCLVVWKLDRLSRSLKDLLTIMERLEELGVGFISLTEAVDTTTPAGRMMMGIIGAFAEFERSLIKERTKAGLEQAKRKGRKLGRPAKFTEEQKEEIGEMLRRGERTKADVARLFGVSPSTVSKVFREKELVG